LDIEYSLLIIFSLSGSGTQTIAMELMPVFHQGFAASYLKAPKRLLQPDSFACIKSVGHQACSYHIDHSKLRFNRLFPKRSLVLPYHNHQHSQPVSVHELQEH